jgi:multisubunit Na+/H+ antiporter MnhB subunit
MSKDDHNTTAKRPPRVDPRDIAVACGLIVAGAGAAGLGFTAFCAFLVVVGTVIIAAAFVGSLR